MDWSSLIGRRPPEPDALRVLLVVDRLGEDDPRPDRARRMVGERGLRLLDHLVDHPATLAYVLIDRFARERSLRDERGEWAEAIRGVVGPPAERRREPVGFEPPRWRRLDASLAFLSSRDLLHVDLDARTDTLAFSTTDAGTGVLTRAHDLAWFERRRRAADAVAERVPERDGESLIERLRAAARRLQSYRRDADLPPEHDPLPELFHVTFRERL